MTLAPCLKQPRPDRGDMLVEVVICLALMAAGSFFWKAVHRSSDMETVERALKKRLDRIIELQEIIHAESAVEFRGTLPELLAREEAEGSNQLGTLADLKGPVLVKDGYCFVIYGVDAAGIARVDPGEARLLPGIWLGVAWPERFGRSGRRLYVVGSFGPGVYWENELGEYSGAARRPRAGLLTPPPGVFWPFKDTPEGWEKSLKWRPVADVFRFLSDD